MKGDQTDDAHVDPITSIRYNNKHSSTTSRSDWQMEDSNPSYAEKRESTIFPDDDETEHLTSRSASSDLNQRENLSWRSSDDASCNSSVEGSNQDSVDGEKKTIRRPWSEEEDSLLRKAVEVYNGSQWKKIAELVPGRSNVQCLQRWRKSLHPSVVKGRWTLQEDQMLLEVVAKNPNFRNWGFAAKIIPGRTAKQCRERYTNHLDPSIKKGGWTREEDLFILKSFKSMGNRWCDIAAHLPGRTENAVKIRYRLLHKSGGKISKRSMVHTRLAGIGRSASFDPPSFHHHQHHAHHDPSYFLTSMDAASGQFIGGGSSGLRRTMSAETGSQLYNSSHHFEDPMGLHEGSDASLPQRPQPPQRFLSHQHLLMYKDPEEDKRHLTFETERQLESHMVLREEANEQPGAVELQQVQRVGYYEFFEKDNSRQSPSYQFMEQQVRSPCAHTEDVMKPIVSSDRSPTRGGDAYFPPRHSNPNHVRSIDEVEHHHHDELRRSHLQQFWTDGLLLHGLGSTSPHHQNQDHEQTQRHSSPQHQPPPSHGTTHVKEEMSFEF